VGFAEGVELFYPEVLGEVAIAQDVFEECCHGRAGAVARQQNFASWMLREEAQFKLEGLEAASWEVEEFKS
jgi:hypothetical protein